jgi:hypothetical protein
MKTEGNLVFTTLLHVMGVLPQFGEKRLRLLQIPGVESFGEPAIDWSEKFASLPPPVLIAPLPRHAHRRSEFPRLCLLLPRDCKRTLEIGFRFFHIRLRRKQCDFAGDASDLGFVPEVG